ncbi:MAG: hypothetical protein ACOX7Q_13410 [Kiritimatiellia bacterium]|jgi:hypothetical protein|nr:hypothetical protein [Kiritimatiellia bacterium]HHU16151.1 hypothetical protein [Lentisphaerota bacterium]HON47981.1 hypothetical protein [Kiritimatiellia bacterium]
MKKVMRFIGITLGVLFVSSVLWIFRPYEKADLRRVEPKLRALETPYREVKAFSFGDGGSMGLEIIDRNGKALVFCLPAPMDEPTLRYNKLFMGAIYYTEPGSSEVPNAHHTKLRLAEIIRSQTKADDDNDVFVYRLSGRWSDLLRFVMREDVFKVY